MHTDGNQSHRYPPFKELYAHVCFGGLVATTGYGNQGARTGFTRMHAYAGFDGDTVTKGVVAMKRVPFKGLHAHAGFHELFHGCRHSRRWRERNLGHAVDEGVDVHHEPPVIHLSVRLHHAEVVQLEQHHAVRPHVRGLRPRQAFDRFWGRPSEGDCLIGHRGMVLVSSEGDCLPRGITDRPHAPSGVAAFMSAHSKTPYITPSVDFPLGLG